MTDLSKPNEVLRSVFGESIRKHTAQMSMTMEYLSSFHRKGHSETITTDEAWAQEQIERKERYEAWKQLTEELMEEGVLDYGHCYECEGPIQLNEQRPKVWIWDETEEEFAERMRTRPPVEFPVKRRD